MKAKFVQFHVLVSYPASLLNRDDVGLAKRIPFGGAVRTRISSQCLKRHWRTYDGVKSLKSLKLPESIRSRRTLEKYLLEPLLNEGIEKKRAFACVSVLQEIMTGHEAKDKQQKAKDKQQESESGDNEPSFSSAKQIVVLGRPEVEYLLKVAREACANTNLSDPEGFRKYFRDREDLKKNLRGLYCGSGLDAALFGRMVTSDFLARTDAAVHVAHAFTVHEEMAEPDYFTAVDDLEKEREELGAGHINTTELSSGLYYLYVVVDVEKLIENITGRKENRLKEDLELAGMVVESLLHTIATVSVGAKKGSTAPYSYASLVIAEIGDSQPRSFANAFLDPVKPPQLLRKTYEALACYLAEVDGMYADGEYIPQRFVAATGPIDALRPHLLGEKESPLSLSGVAQRIRAAILEGADA
jgi:CRISPR system Cascade subunit CasC